MNHCFKYFQFIELDYHIYGRPANVYPPVIKIHGMDCINVFHRDFEEFAIEMTFEAMDSSIKPGLYDSSDIELTLPGISGRRYYQLKDLLPSIENGKYE